MPTGNDNSIRRSRQLAALAKHQVVGVLGQVAFAVPTLAVSIVLSRTGHLAMVADLALAFGISAVVFTFFSFGLRAHLSLWGFTRYRREVFVANRAIGVALAVVVAVGMLAVIHISVGLILTVVLLKLADTVQDLTFGLTLAEESVSVALSKYLTWSALRMLIFLFPLAVLAASHFDMSKALVLAAAVQALFAVVAPLKTFSVADTRLDLSQIGGLSKSSLPLSISAICCSFLTTLPRASIQTVYAAPLRGFAGIAFIVGTFYGMAFNTVWVRSSVTVSAMGLSTVAKRFFLEGGALAVVLTTALYFLGIAVSLIYHVNDPAFLPLFMSLGAALVLFFFAMSCANLLKATKRPSLEAVVHTVGAALFLAFIRLLNNMNIALVLTSVAIVISVIIFVRGRYAAGSTNGKGYFRQNSESTNPASLANP